MSDFENLLERLSKICGDCENPYFALFDEADTYTHNILNRGIILLDSSVSEAPILLVCTFLVVFQGRSFTFRTLY